MSRIGKKIIAIPKGVDVKVAGDQLEVKGPKGTLRERVHPAVKVEVKDGVLTCHKVRDEKGDDAAHGLVRALAANMVTGVTEGFQKVLEIVGVGYRAQVAGRRADAQRRLLEPGELPGPEGDRGRRLGEEPGGHQGDRQAPRRHGRRRGPRHPPPEPYKGKGIKYVDERIRRKVGKTGA